MSSLKCEENNGRFEEVISHFEFKRNLLCFGNFSRKRKKEEVGSDYKIENCAIYIQQIKPYFYYSHTVWKFENFSTTHILREIEIGESRPRVTKSAIITN